jgi:hypothetical protein
MFIIPAYALPIASRYGDHGNIEKASQRGVRLRGITDISHANLDTVREYVDLYADFGYELRHYYQYHGLFFLVSDGKESLSMINADVKGLSLNETVVALGVTVFLCCPPHIDVRIRVGAISRCNAANTRVVKRRGPPIEGR